MTTLDVDILHPSAEAESRTCKKKTLIPNPRSCFLSLRCPDCQNCTDAFSHADIIVQCQECGKQLAYPTGGLIRLAEGVEKRPKVSA